MGQNPGLFAFAEHFGIELKPLEKFDDSPKRSLGILGMQVMVSKTMDVGASVLFTTNSWMEVTETLLGKDRVLQSRAV